MPAAIVLTPATLAWSPLFAGYYTYLGLNVAKFRVKTGYMLGERSEGSVKADPDSDLGKKVVKDPAEAKEAERQLQIATRAHGNFSENVPLAMLLIGFAELNGAPTWLVHSAYAVLFSVRVAHVELGLKGKGAVAGGRLTGFLGSFGVMLLTSAYNFRLGLRALQAFVGQI